jgi:nucleoside-diphosphate-sugar epimerase
MALHTILGAYGTVSTELVPVLLKNKERIRLVSRKSQPVEGTETIAADLLNPEQVMNAVKGSTFVYLLVGLQYNTNVWKSSWPLIMQNVISACKVNHAKLIFFDNVYMYGKVKDVMTEDTPFNPSSKKGIIRAAIVTTLLNEMKQGNIKALIARSADFYGPVNFKNSVPNMLVFDNFRKGKSAQWLVNATVPHSFTYVPDAAKALYLLANNEAAFGQTWHLPTASNPLTGKEFIQLAAKAMNAKNKYMVLSKWMLRLAGLFNADIRESYEMLYQAELPYFFDSTKFNTAFNFRPISYEEGIKATAAYFLK